MFTCNLTNCSVHSFFRGTKYQVREKLCKTFLLSALWGFHCDWFERNGRKLAHPATPTSLFDSGYRIPRFGKKVKWIYYFLERTLDTFYHGEHVRRAWKKDEARACYVVLDIENYVHDNGVATAESALLSRDPINRVYGIY